MKYTTSLFGKGEKLAYFLFVSRKTDICFCDAIFNKATKHIQEEIIKLEIEIEDQARKVRKQCKNCENCPVCSHQIQLNKLHQKLKELKLKETNWKITMKDIYYTHKEKCQDKKDVRKCEEINFL